MYEYTATITNIVDGDTFDAQIDLGFGISFRERFRLSRVDTPETYGVKKDSEEYKAGLLAKNRVQMLVDKYPEVIIVTEKDKKGKYGRYIAEVLFDNKKINLSDLLVNDGLAVYVKY